MSWQSLKVKFKRLLLMSAKLRPPLTFANQVESIFCIKLLRFSSSLDRLSCMQQTSLLRDEFSCSKYFQVSFIPFLSSLISSSRYDICLVRLPLISIGLISLLPFKEFAKAFSVIPLIWLSFFLTSAPNYLSQLLRELLSASHSALLRLISLAFS